MNRTASIHIAIYIAISSLAFVAGERTGRSTEHDKAIQRALAASETCDEIISILHNQLKGKTTP